MEFLDAVVRIAAPLSCAASGELIGERAGTVNLGIEGGMVLGAYVGWRVAAWSGSPSCGLVAAAALGVFCGTLFWFLTELLECNQHVVGLGLGFAYTGLALTLFRLAPSALKASRLIPTGSEGRILLVCCCGATALLIATAIAPRLHRWGLAWHILGRDVRAADLAGVPIRQVRLVVCMLSWAMCFAGGAVLSVLIVHNFTLGLVSGRGWVALSLVLVARWRPVLLLIAVACWGVIEASELLAQASGARVPYQLLLMLPYLLCTIVVAFGRSVRGGAPRIDQTTYLRNEDSA